MELFDSRRSWLVVPQRRCSVLWVRADFAQRNLGWGMACRTLMARRSRPTLCFGVETKILFTAFSHPNTQTKFIPLFNLEPDRVAPALFPFRTIGEMGVVFFHHYRGDFFQPELNRSLFCAGWAWVAPLVRFDLQL